MLRYLFLLGILNIAFNFLWKWVAVVPISLLLALFNTSRGLLLLKAIGAYLLVSCTALLTVSMVKESGSSFDAVAYPILGGLVLYLGIASHSYEACKQAGQSFDYEMLDALKYDGLFIVGSVVFFVVCIFLPNIAVNIVTLRIFEVISWAYELPVIGWILGIAGVLVMLSVLWQGLIFSIFVVGRLYYSVTRKSGQIS